MSPRFSCTRARISAIKTLIRPWHFEGAERLERLWNALPLPDLASGDQTREARMRRACPDAERAVVSDTLLPEYDNLTDIANAVETFDDALSFYRAFASTARGMPDAISALRRSYRNRLAGQPNFLRHRHAVSFRFCRRAR